MEAWKLHDMRNKATTNPTTWKAKSLNEFVSMSARHYHAETEATRESSVVTHSLMASSGAAAEDEDASIHS
eukprot:4973204-Amphidinium_carterae.1